MGKFTVLVCVLVFVTLGFSQIVIDGDINDWHAEMQVDLAPNAIEEVDDYDRAYLDIMDVYMYHDADSLYIRIDINENGVFSDIDTEKEVIQLFFDADMNDTTGLTWGWWATGCDYVMIPSNPHDAVFSGVEGGFKEKWGIGKFVGANQSDYQIADTEVGGNVAINGDDNIMEISVPRTILGDTVDFQVGERIFVYTSENETWTGDLCPNNLGSETVDYFYPMLMADITTDGDMGDWKAEMQVDLAPNSVEEVDDYDRPHLDIKDVFVANDLDSLYIRIDINENGAFNDIDINTEVIQLFLDSDVNDTTGLTWGWWITGCDYVMIPSNPHDAVFSEVEGGFKEKWGIGKFIGENQSDYKIADTEMGGNVRINQDDNIMEISIPRIAIADTNIRAERTRIFVYTSENVTWSGDLCPNNLGSETVEYAYGYVPADYATTIRDIGGNKIPENMFLANNYPNPFNPSTTIEFALNRQSQVEISIYNLTGQKIATLLKGYKNAGNHQVRWNGLNQKGNKVASGLYFYQLRAENQVITKKMLLTK